MSSHDKQEACRSILGTSSFATRFRSILLYHKRVLGFYWGTWWNDGLGFRNSKKFLTCALVYIESSEVISAFGHDLNEISFFLQAPICALGCPWLKILSVNRFIVHQGMNLSGYAMPNMTDPLSSVNDYLTYLSNSTSLWRQPLVRMSRAGHNLSKLFATCWKSRFWTGYDLRMLTTCRQCPSEAVGIWTPPYLGILNISSASFLFLGNIHVPPPWWLFHDENGGRWN